LKELNMNSLDPVTAYSIPSGMGGAFTASIIEDMGEQVRMRVWYGKPTAKGWRSWGDFDGTTRTVNRADLRNEHTLNMVRKVEDENAGFFFVQPYEAEGYTPEQVAKRYVSVYPDSDVFRMQEVNDQNLIIKSYLVDPATLPASVIEAARQSQNAHEIPGAQVTC
jgi:hypothetical protein